MDLVFTEAAYARLARNLLGLGAEACAIAQCRVVKTSGTGFRLLAHDVVLASDSDYESRSPVSAVLRPAFVGENVSRAAHAGGTVALIHTHPGGRRLPGHSSIDDDGERALAGLLQYRLPGVPHVSVVLNDVGAAARTIPVGEPVRVVSVGHRLRFVSERTHAQESERFDRQVRALGDAGQARLSSLRVGIVGLGGTGSVVAQQLAYLGVRDFLLIDPDHVDETNLNRLVGASSRDLGAPKIAVARETIHAVVPEARVDAACGDVRFRDDAHRLLDVDLFFCCTDSQGSRAILNQLSYQYLIPCIDMGAVIEASEGPVRAAFGRVQLLSPGRPCLLCSSLLDPETVRRDLMTDEERRADPYIMGPPQPQPAVVTINSVIGSLATTMLLGVVTEFPAEARVQLYDVLRGVVRRGEYPPIGGCIVCSHSGATGRGGEWPLPARTR